MKIPLHNFEVHIDEKILSRGLSYFKKGYVRNVDEISPGEYEATVDGSDEYSISLSVRNGNIEQYSCNCPYDVGPVCKHLAAVIFHLQQDLSNAIPKAEKTKAGGLKPKSDKELVTGILAKLSHGDLKGFIEEESKGDAIFRQSFISRFNHLVDEESLAFYKKQVQAIIHSVIGRNNFIEWDDAPKIAKPVGNLLNVAKRHADSGNLQGCIFICCAILEELTEAIGYADDSRGTLGNNIDAAFGLLLEISSTELHETIRVPLLEYCMETFKKGIFSDWDWHIGMLEIALNLIGDDKEADAVIELLEGLSHSEYEKEEAQMLKLRILISRQRNKEADIFIQKNITNPAIRKKVIADLVTVKQFDKAISIAKDGIKYDAKDRPGLIHQWHEELLHIAVIQNDVEEIIQYARLLFLSHFREKDPYYTLMKSHVTATEWEFFLEKLVKEIKQKNKWSFVDEVAYIFIQEQWWEKLLALIGDKAHLETVSAYDRYLIKDYPQEVAHIYGQIIPVYLETNVSRAHYQTACRYLRRMIKCGAHEKVEELKEYFRKKYPQRRALMEELDLV